MEGINWGWVFAGAALGWSILSFVWMRSINQQSASKSEIAKIYTEIATTNSKIEEVSKHVTRLEVNVEDLPTREMVHRIDKEVTEVRSALKPIGEAVKRIDDFFMTQKRSSRR